MTGADRPELTRGRRIATLTVLGLLAGLGPFTIDLYLPAFPQLRAEFGVTDSLVQVTLSATTLGFALGQLIVGPLSDRLGRRRPLLVATSVHVLASVGVAIAPDIGSLMLMRVLQGFGAAAGSVVALAMVRDLFSGSHLVTALSRLSLVIGLAPVAAPVLGSWLLGIVQWRGLFWALAAYAGLVIVLQLVFLRETLPRHLRSGRDSRTLWHRYRAVLTDRVFIGVAVIGAGMFAGVFVYLATSSLLLQEAHGLTAGEYGVVLAITAVSVMTGSQTAARISRRFGPARVLAFSTALLVVGATGVVVGDVAGAGVVWLVAPLALFSLAFGLSIPCVQALALMGHANEAGTAASLLGAANMSIAGLIIPVAGLFSTATALPMGLVMLGCAVAAVLSLWLVVRPAAASDISRD